MSFGGLSLIYIIIALFIFKNPNKILLSMVFFTPFVESFVVCFNNSWKITPGHFYLALYLLIIFIYNAQHNHTFKLSIGFSFNISLFVFIAFISILVSALLGIDVPVYGIGNGVELKSSLVSKQNFTQFLYLLTGWIAYICVFIYCSKNTKNWDKIVNVMILSTFTVFLIGFYQLISVKYNLPYDEIFRQTAKNGVHDIWQTKNRVSATFTEASFFGQYCTYAIALALYLKSINRKRLCYLMVAIITVLGVLSKSTTILIGAVSLIIVMFLFSIKNLSSFFKYISKIFVVILMCCWSYLNIDQFSLIINSAILKFKLENVSGIERCFVSKYMFNIGLQHPFLGIGYGGGRSLDLYTNLISTTGFIGFITFFSYIIIRHLDDPKARMCVLLLIGFLSTSLSIPDLSYMPLWCILGLCDAYRYLITNNRIKSTL